jgi:hypothetical protein
VYDVFGTHGFVNIGLSSDTAEFGVESLNRFYLWKVKWKAKLQELANRLGKEITVMHFPPGTSKRNKIEHRLFSFISKNRRGKPLISAAVICYHRETMKRYFVLFLTATALLYLGCTPDSDSTDGPIHPLGVWWWDSPLIRDSRYLDFAVQNHVNEIYLARADKDIEDFGFEIEEFVEKAREQGIKVYLLLGFGYIPYEYPRLQDALRLYKDYQARVSEGRRFEGIHLDIEFHADYPGWEDIGKQKQTEILAEYLALIVRLRSEIPETRMEIDIPAWFDQIMSYNGEERPLYQILIDTVDRVFVMSYRDTAEEMYKIAREEVSYAMSVNKPIMLGAELQSEEGDHVSYMEEGRRYLYEQLKFLEDMVNYSKAGVSIHHIKTWYELHD